MQEMILRDILYIFVFTITKFMFGVWLQKQIKKENYISTL